MATKMPRQRRRTGRSERWPIADRRDRALMSPHNRELLSEELPGLPREIATGEDPLILAGVVAVWLDSEEEVAP